jgi:glutathione S-transferase
VRQIADLVYRGRDDVVLLEIDQSRLVSPVHVDEVDGGDAFPHIYGPLNIDAVVRVIALPRLDDDGLSEVDALFPGRE